MVAYGFGGRIGRYRQRTARFRVKSTMAEGNLVDAAPGLWGAVHVIHLGGRLMWQHVEQGQGGIVLVREGAALYEAFHARGSYMQDMEGMGVEQAHSACDFSPELTRPFRGLRLWLPLKLSGVAPFRAALEEKLLLAEHFYEEIGRLDGFVTGPPPDLSIVAFRYRPTTGDANDFNRRLFEAIRDDGRIFISTTTLDGAFTLRLAILSYHTHRRDIDVALEVIEEQARKLAEQ